MARRCTASPCCCIQRLGTQHTANHNTGRHLESLRNGGGRPLLTLLSPADWFSLNQPVGMKTLTDPVNCVKTKRASSRNSWFLPTSWVSERPAATRLQGALGRLDSSSRCIASRPLKYCVLGKHVEALIDTKPAEDQDQDGGGGVRL